MQSNIIRLRLLVVLMHDILHVGVYCNTLTTISEDMPEATYICVNTNHIIHYDLESVSKTEYKLCRFSIYPRGRRMTSN
jgi:hypothetical protein